MEEYLSLKLHEEYAKRMDDEHKRQNHRISTLEKAVEQNNKLLTAVLSLQPLPAAPAELYPQY